MFKKKESHSELFNFKNDLNKLQFPNLRLIQISKEITLY